MVSCPGFNLTAQICGTQVSIHWLWIIFYALAILGSFYEKNFLYVIFVVILDGPILLFTIVTMMIGISMMVKATGGTTEGVIIFPFWGVTKYGQPLHNKGPRGDLMIALAGPLACIAQGAAWFGFFFLAAKEDMFYFNYIIYFNLLEENFLAVLLCNAVVLNIVLVVLNFLPAYPLAGGRILAAVMLTRNVAKPRVALITGKSGLAVAFLGCIYGLLSFFVWNGSDAVFIFVACIVVGWYSAALFKIAAEGNFDDHEIFFSSRSTTDVNNVNAMAAPQAVDATATVETGSEAKKKPWWKGGKNTNKSNEQEGKASKEPEIDYGY